ncbi:MAG TPA: endonuclease/exonuclease/phosphatase family protein [Bryobacteraceae bacterium]|nr:endonuclease/exonuclease/phosphatase family protein [Bryobacteraceae bacterium]
MFLTLASLLTGTLNAEPGNHAQPRNYACADQAPFTFAELTALAKNPLSPALENKLNRVLAEPVVCNDAAIPRDAGGHPVRIVEWNVNHGLNEREIEAALRGPGAFHARVTADPRGGSRARLDEELQVLSQADVIVLDEVDCGVGRTQYRNIARDLAGALGMNYAYGVEFVELERIYLGLDRADNVNLGRYRATEGTVVLSRYPIARAEVVRLPMKYDWYGSEVKAVTDLEKARRWSAERVFDEHINGQVRRGGRMALMVNLRVPESPTGFLSVVCPHLENYTTPAGRAEQMNYLLRHIQNNPNPLVLAGDLNSTGADAQPVSVRRELLQRAKSVRFWASQALFVLTPVTGLRYMLYPIDYFKNFHDPTAISVPLALANPEAAQFGAVKSFQFCDGGAFDRGGDPRLSHGLRGGAFSGSNQRAWKGFVPTFALKRTYHGVVGEYKTDWFLVKPAPPLFLPFNGRTLNEVNRAPLVHISDHAPIVVWLATAPLGTAPPNRVSPTQSGRDGSPAHSRGPASERCAAPPE